MLLLGLWSVAARWIAEPRLGLALLAGLIAGAILLTHGTEVYSSIVGLAVIAALRWRRIRWRQLAVLLPRSAPGPLQEARTRIAASLVAVQSSPRRAR